MGGKGRRRREKNYRAAHGGPARLPPPPDPSQVEALPSKLRKIMSFTTDSPHGSFHLSLFFSLVCFLSFQLFNGFISFLFLGEHKAEEGNAEKKVSHL